MAKINTLSIGQIPSSPVGPLWVAVSERGLFAVEFNGSLEEFVRQVKRRAGQAEVIQDQAHTAEACRQISEYLQGQRQVFDFPVDLSGLSPFQQAVLQTTAAIPFGKIRTYKEIAAMIGRPGAARAVGRGEATNPLPLVIPCHRVVGSDGSLHGYGGPGGVNMKAWLLNLEQAERLES